MTAGRFASGAGHKLCMRPAATQAKHAETRRPPPNRPGDRRLWSGSAAEPAPKEYRRPAVLERLCGDARQDPTTAKKETGRSAALERPCGDGGQRPDDPKRNLANGGARATRDGAVKDSATT